MVPVAAMMTMAMTAIAFRCLDGGNAQGGQDAGGQEQTDTDKAHVTYSRLNAARTLTAGPPGCKRATGRITHP